MASVVDICNIALGHLGDEAVVTAINPPDGSAQADHCKRYYPIARDALLEMHNWRFAMRREELALLDTDELPSGWAFAYAYPTCIKVLGVYPPASIATSPAGAIFDSSEFINVPKSQQFVIESLEDGTQVIYTNMENATVRFVGLVTDSTKFSPLFVMALARLLASLLAGPIIKGKEGRAETKSQLEQFEKLDGMRAKVSDSQAGKEASYDTFIPSHIMARS